MSLRREVVEAVVDKHISPHLWSSFWRKNLVDDLLALVPTPSREALEKLLMQWESRIIWNVNFQKGKSVIPERLDELMAWASGQPEQRWCEHMSYNNGHWTLKDRTWAIPSGMTWQFCPLCASPRPT